MNFENLEESLIDMVIEARIKLGGPCAKINLNYILPALNNLFDTNLNCDEMSAALGKFISDSPEFKNITVKLEDDDIFRFTVPAENVKYIDEHYEKPPFLVEFINTMRCCNDEEKIFALFRKYSDKVCICKPDCEDFDYLVYFEDGKPDEHYYCLTLEGLCITYHRFTKKDYDSFNFRLL